MYTRLTKGLNDKGILIKPEELDNYIDDINDDYYASINYYTEEHYKKFKETGSVAGITDVQTDKLVFDFDCKTDLEQARQDALEIINRLETKLNIKKSNIEIYFSGQKGFTISIKLKQMISPEKASNLALNVLGKNLKTLDKSLYNASRILRIPNTRHPESGLFKTQLSYKQLLKLSIERIKEYATEPQNLKDVEEAIEIPESLLVITEEKEKQKVNSQYSLDFSRKPPQWRNCKWSLLQGNFESGERHNALTVLAATCRGLGYDKETTYYMCKAALKKQAIRTKQEEFSKEELFQNIIEQSVFTDNWEGGQYTCQKPGFLQDYCQRLGEHTCKDHNEDEKMFVKFDDMAERFFKFAENFEANIIKTGIKELDKHAILAVSTLNGLLGQPGAGKTTMALNYLKNTSRNGISSGFFSLDMGEPIVAAKIIQQKVGMSFSEAMQFCREQKQEARLLINEIMKEDYANVDFCFKAGLTVSDIKEGIKTFEAENQKKMKLVVVDYLECLAGPYNDPTANVGFIANQLKDLANELQVCVLLLLQTQKHSTPDISDPLLTLKGVKGSSLIEQSCTSILTLWREGYNPKFQDDDKYVSFAIVKNRFGGLWTGDFSWNPVTGDISSLTEEERFEFEEFKKRKKQEKIQALTESEKEWQ